MAMKLIHGSDTVAVIALVNYWQGQGYAPACGLSYHNGVYFQPVVPGDAGGVPYGIIDEVSDVAFQNGASYAQETYGAFALGDLQFINGAFVQAFGKPVVPAAPPPVNEVFRASFTTTSGELTQLVAAANTPQVVTFNTQQIPNANLGTLNNATGVFTAARDIKGMLTLSAQVRRGLSGATTWAIQVETSPDGVTWTPVAGSLRQVRLSNTETGVTRVVDFTTVVNLPAGTRLRFTQMVDTAANQMGIVALAASLGGTTAAGFIMGLYTVN